MFTLQWPVCIWVCMVTHTRSQLESNVNYFQILNYPTELSARYDFNKNATLKWCYDYHDDDAVDAVDAVHTQSITGHNFAPIPKKEHNAFLLKMLTNIAQQIRQRRCGKSNSSTTMSTATRSLAQAEPAAETVASSERSLRVYYKGQRPEDGPFNILEQLKLDEKRQQQQHKLKLQSQQEPQQQQLAELQEQVLWADASFENLGKAGKKKKKKPKRKKKKKKKKPTKEKDKKQKKKKKKKTKKRKQQPKPSLVGQPAHVLFASLTQKPQFQQHHHVQPQTTQHVTLPLPLTTSKPHHHPTPVKKIKYILRQNTIFKKKKKEYLNHLKQVLYPFVKFIAFFTILNPFTLAVFLFTLISPVVFGFIGFVGLSFLIKPALNLLFGVKRTVSSINRQKSLQKRRRERLRNSRRPITIHKHYYQQTRLPPQPAAGAPHRQRRPTRHQKHQQHHRHSKHFNPLLPHVKHKLKKDALFGPNFVRSEMITNDSS